MAEKDKKYFWLKLKRDFFKRHDIRIIESMPNGKDYILFYLKLLCESVDHNGNLRFSENIPYNENMLATITDTNVDIVRSAVKVFTELGMMEVMDDGTYYMTEVNKMIGSETYWAEQKRKQRSLDNVQHLSIASPTCPSKSQSKSKNKIKSKNDDLSILKRLKGEEKENLINLCGDYDNFTQLIRYADVKISQREDDEPISNPYQYLIAIGINDGFIKEN
jgi:predicted phage replisome organizer